MLSIGNAFCKIAIAPERGAIVTSLQVQGQEALYLDQATFDDPKKNVRGGIPVLFPICGPLASADYEVDERRYGLKQHGFARNLPWRVLEQQSGRVSLELSASVETRTHYPFEFRYQLDYSAQAEGLLIEQRIENHSAKAMPVQFGFHPYFLVGGKEHLEFELPVSSYSDNKSSEQGEFTGFDFARDEIDWAFPNLTGREASFVDRSRGTRITVSYGEAYQELVFWTLKGSPFVCVEPWSSSRLAFPDGDGIHQIAPGEALSTSVEVTLTSVSADSSS